MLSGQSAAVGFSRKPVVDECPQVEPHQSWDAADDECERIPILATQSQQLNERAIRPQAALEEADFLLQRRAALFIAEEAVVDGALEYSHCVFGYSGMYGEDRRAQQCHREQREERLEDVKTANRRGRNEREH